jgi:hypothetical protein
VGLWGRRLCGWESWEIKTYGGFLGEGFGSCLGLRDGVEWPGFAALS